MSRTSRFWIVNGWSDLLLFIGTPLLIVPAVLMMRTRYSLDSISMVVAAFGAMGHHLPGMLRAYGDRALFARFRFRFTVAPLFLLAVCVPFAHADLKSLGVLLTVWALWHALMQVYGFVRIYDAKAKSVARITARIDFQMCLAWFVGGFLFSPGRVLDFLSVFYEAGGPLISPALTRGLRILWAGYMAVATVAFLVNYVHKRWTGTPPSPVKLVTLVTSIAFWWYAMVLINNAILGVVMFELFHDIQYLAIVWLFNRRRVESGESISRFSQFLFRRSWILIGLYVGIVMAYGGISLFPVVIGSDAFQKTVAGIVAASAFLHFYYDGFIWKIREPATRKTLSLQDADSPKIQTAANTDWVVHGSKWLAFVIPVAILAVGQDRGTATTLDRKRNLVANVPVSASAHSQLAASLQEHGLQDEAEYHFRLALRGNPRLLPAKNNLGILLVNQGRATEAADHFRQAVKIDPSHVESRINLGLLLLKQGQFAESAVHFQAALDEDPRHANAHNNLGVALLNLSRPSEAAQHFRAALDNQPGFQAARRNLDVAISRSRGNP